MIRQQDDITTSASALTLIAAVLLPPLGVFMGRGITPAFWVTVALTLLAFVPGVIFALVAILAPRSIPIR